MPSESGRAGHTPPPGAAGYVDHIGIAVRDLDEGIALYRDLLGLELERVEEVPGQNVRVAFLKLDRTGSVGHVELLAPLSDQGPLADFLAKRGPGLHHIAVAARDLDELRERCRSAGLQVLGEQTRAGASGKAVVFLHPKSAQGVLLELCGPARP